MPNLHKRLEKIDTLIRALTSPGQNPSPITMSTLHKQRDRIVALMEKHNDRQA